MDFSAIKDFDLNSEMVLVPRQPFCRLCCHYYPMQILWWLSFYT